MGRSEGGADGDSRFVYIKEPGKDTGALTMWNTKTGKTQALTLQMVDQDTIYIQEYEYYLTRFKQETEKTVTLHMLYDPAANFQTNDSQQQILFTTCGKPFRARHS